MGLQTYEKKRDFGRTPEPRGSEIRVKHAAPAQFVVQKHDASRLHYDFRLEVAGVLVSWAVPKGPSLDPKERRLAVQTEDHPLDYADFEGVIPKDEYGGGSVVVWDRGFWSCDEDPEKALDKGRIDFTLEGDKLRGGWRLVRMKKKPREKQQSWLLMKRRDDAANPGLDIVAARPESVLTGRSVEQVAEAEDRVWHSNRDAPDAEVARLDDPSRIEGGKKGPLPKAPGVQLATLVEEAPAGDGWLHELKLDGYRLICVVDRGKVKLLTRRGHDWTARFAPIAEAARAWKDRRLVLDGEAVVMDSRGHSDFGALQNALGQARDDLFFYAFDLLYADGVDLRGAPLRARKEALRLLLTGHDDGTIRYSDHVVGRGAPFFEQACAAGTEGIISKRADAPYRAGRGRGWLKVKCRRREELVVVGFTEPEGSRVGLGALVLATREDQGSDLRYAGKVGTGFSDETLGELRATLEERTRDEPPMAAHLPPRDRRRITWVQPDLVAEIAFHGWTADGHVRHAAFVGLREDKPAAEVHREKAVPLPDPESLPKAGKKQKATKRAKKKTRAKKDPPKKGAAQKRKAAKSQAAKSQAAKSQAAKSQAAKSQAAKSQAAKSQPTKNQAAKSQPTKNQSPRRSQGDGEVAGVRISSPDKVMFEEAGITKLQLAQYYEAVAEVIMPGLADRPLTLLRCPDGRNAECFFQKKANRSTPKKLPRVRVKKDTEYLAVHELADLITLVQLGVLELHVWGSRVDRVERPDLLVLDLDPDPGVAWQDVVTTAQALRERLAQLGLAAFARTTGGKGLHVVTPVERRLSWEQAKGFTHGLARELVAAAPERYTDNISKAQRKGKILVDYLRNAADATAIASYSVRAREGGPVAVPVEWAELEGTREPPRWSLDEVMARVAGGADPWRDFDAGRARLTKAALREVGVD